MSMVRLYVENSCEAEAWNVDSEVKIESAKNA
jgi:hypothetical protein